jgi:hypothetical protein
VRLLEQIQELLTDLKNILEEERGAEGQENNGIDDLDDWGVISGSENSTTEIEEIHQGLVETIMQLYQMSMIIRKPAQHDRLVGTSKQDSEPFQFWAKQHISNKYPNADALAIDRISSAMARQRAILKYRERHHTKLSQGIDSGGDGKSAMLSETVVTDLFKEIPGQFSDMVSDTGASETSYGGTLLEGTGADAPKIPPIPKNGREQRPFECPYCFYIITARDKRAWARHIFRDLMPYVCIIPGCSTPSKLYEGRRQWYHHIREIHASTLSTEGLYDCSICSQGALSVATFQRHVGQHLEELALFLIPRTDTEDDEDAVTDEEKGTRSIDDNLSDGSLGSYAGAQNVEQRNDRNRAATSASESDHGGDYRSGWPHNKSKHYTSSVGTNLSDREPLERLESDVEDKKRASSPSYIRDDELVMKQKLPEKSDFAENMEIRKQQQQIDNLRRELDKHRGRAEPLDARKSQILQEEEEWYEDEISDRLRNLGRLELNRAEKERRDAERLEEGEKDAARLEGIKRTDSRGDLKVNTKLEAAERERLRRKTLEEDRRTAAEVEDKKKKEQVMKAAAIEQWKQEQERRRKEETVLKDKEFRERLRSEFGYTEEEIEHMLNKKTKKTEWETDKKKVDEEKTDQGKATWIKVCRYSVLQDWGLLGNQDTNWLRSTASTCSPRPS